MEISQNSRQSQKLIIWRYRNKFWNTHWFQLIMKNCWMQMYIWEQASSLSFYDAVLVIFLFENRWIQSQNVHFCQAFPYNFSSSLRMKIIHKRNPQKFGSVLPLLCEHPACPQDILHLRQPAVLLANMKFVSQIFQQLVW